MLCISSSVFSYSLNAASMPKQMRGRAAVMSFDQEAFIAESKEMRLKHLEEQARRPRRGQTAGATLVPDGC